MGFVLRAREGLVMPQDNMHGASIGPDPGQVMTPNQKSFLVELICEDSSPTCPCQKLNVEWQRATDEMKQRSLFWLV